MTLSQNTVEQLFDWCASAPELAARRAAARSIFFGEDDPAPVSYWPGAGDHEQKERRFLGHFMFEKDDTGSAPVALAAARILHASEQNEALAALAGARWVVASVKSIVRRSVFLSVGSEEIECRHAYLAQMLQPKSLAALHVVPLRNRTWLVGPGWVALPISIGPNMAASPESFQFSPIQLERLIQGRGSAPDEQPRQPIIQDETLDDAVARMTRWATENGQPSLVRPAAWWSEQVLSHMAALDAVGLNGAILEQLEGEGSIERVQHVCELVSNIWNNTPQPDRDGRSPREIVELDEPAVGGSQRVAPRYFVNQWKR